MNGKAGDSAVGPVPEEKRPCLSSFAERDIPVAQPSRHRGKDETCKRAELRARSPEFGMTGRPINFLHGCSSSRRVVENVENLEFCPVRFDGSWLVQPLSGFDSHSAAKNLAFIEKETRSIFREQAVGIVRLTCSVYAFGVEMPPQTHPDALARLPIDNVKQRPHVRLGGSAPEKKRRRPAFCALHID